jgi:hypothetical protein
MRSRPRRLGATTATGAAVRRPAATGASVLYGGAGSRSAGSWGGARRPRVGRQLVEVGDQLVDDLDLASSDVDLAPKLL